MPGHPKKKAFSTLGSPQTSPVRNTTLTDSSLARGPRRMAAPLPAPVTHSAPLSFSGTSSYAASYAPRRGLDVHRLPPPHAQRRSRPRPSLALMRLHAGAGRSLNEIEAAALADADEERRLRRAAEERARAAHHPAAAWAHAPVPRPRVVHSTLADTHARLFPPARPSLPRRALSRASASYPHPRPYPSPSQQLRAASSLGLRHELPPPPPAPRHRDA
ncbi:uncharacterized protein AMSG_07263 [Thecamonas trahens ATCC 50062]|uniref:Uncharacterized protein n=1 Tax=Thecamonas trahens ATCC 50062 TaxID=461836 RepID=A0A0L0DGE8_THETB|nr:hypothetical protein AMSG_07263 [Thecamonas trahens ATCC 50062]KNC51260.1 hypothetical protein AMSG_07263 [Thecamonas trahens ATCC 50062]|eukprot:XP_013756190.1 hypothetical protein AMSG_07263 [Thecamonas trahens ATCC 50062]